MQQKMPLGVDDFKKLRDKQCYFVDKTDFIRQLIDGHSEVTLFTRPRRFGKTLTLSMLEWFFSAEKKKASRTLFQSLSIDRAGNTYMQERGQHPVLFLSFKDFSDLTWPDMLATWRIFFQDICLHYSYVKQSPRVQPELVKVMETLADKKADVSTMASAVSLLLHVLHQYYGKKVILLLDEYDKPIEQAWESGYYKECIAFMRQMLGSSLKTNEDLDFGILTGVLRVAKESIFSGLNNLEVCTVTSKKYADVFGFTPEEVAQMARELDMEASLPDIRRWYDGYHFGGQEIYNPWSVINFFDKKELADYWVNTSNNGILRFLLTRTDKSQLKTLQNLLEGGTVPVTLNEQVVYANIDKEPSALYTLLLTTGYLTAAAVSPVRRNRYGLRIPNEELKDVFKTEILNNIAADVTENTFDNLFDALFAGDGESFSDELQLILRQFVSTFDAASKESFYHGFMLGLTALFLGSGYTVESNRESGYGRFDIAIFPKDTAKTGVIMEFKAAPSEAMLAKKAEEAVQQIEKQAYAAEFTKRGIGHVWKYGIAFCGKKVRTVQK